MADPKLSGPVKPAIDECHYRVVTLENGLKALLVSDAQADKAAAAVDVSAHSEVAHSLLLGLGGGGECSRSRAGSNPQAAAAARRRPPAAPPAAAAQVALGAQALSHSRLP